MLVGACCRWSSTRRSLVDNVHLGVAPTWKDFVLAIPIGMIAYTGIETISNMAEEAKDEAKTIPAAIDARARSRCSRSTSRCRRSRSSALPVERDPDGEYMTLLGLPEEEGGYAGDPIAGRRRAMDLGPLQTPVELYVGLLAATILFLATNAGLIGVSRLVYSMGIHRQLPDALRRLHPQVPHAVDRDHRLRRRRDPGHAARARRRSSATSTRSARCCRSRSRTWR